MSSPAFPISTLQLGDWLPHRGPAVWIDEVTRVADDEGECRVHLKTSANYAGPRARIRDSSFVEWIAQAYGYVCAAQVLTGLVKAEKKPEKAFLVHVKDLELSPDPGTNLLFEGDWISVRVRRTHQVGPIALVDGAVYSSKDILLARAKVKLYAE